jgi:ABC-2 type transport system permease protein
MSLTRSISSVFTIAEMEARKIRHDSTELWMRSVQPALWLLIFGEVLNSVKVLAPAGYSYIQYIAPGVLAQSVLFVAIFYGITIVWERDVGLLTKLLSTPSPRSSIVVGKAMASAVRGVFQAAVIFVLSLLLGIQLRLDLPDVLGVFGIVVMLSICFSSFSMVLASFLKTRDRMMGIGQVLTMPLFFASSAIYPISLMPTWLKYVAYVNPLSYVVDALRSLLLTGDYSSVPLDMAALLVATVFFAALASVVVKRLVQ